MSRLAYSEAQKEWMRANVPLHRSWKDAHMAFMEAFPDTNVGRTWRPLATWASRNGVRLGHGDYTSIAGRCHTKVFWSREPEMYAWMLENDKGRSTPAVSADFEREFGFPLTCHQIQAFRRAAGTQTKNGTPEARDARSVPVGTRRKTKGAVLVKVREYPSVPGSKDNWEFEHHIAYREAYGGIPEGCIVVAKDGDKGNLDPSNLAAVPTSLIGVMNGVGYDADTFDEVFRYAQARTDVGQRLRETRTCQVCGMPFVQGKRAGNRQTCPDCLAQGRKSRGVRDAGGEKACVVCGERFTAPTKTTVRCGECRKAKPGHSPMQHREYFEKHGRR